MDAELTVFADDVAALLDAAPRVGAAEQAFPFLTVTEDGYPHVCLLSRAELRVVADRSALCAVVTSTRTRANLSAAGHAGLIAIAGTTAHYLKLRTVEVVDDGPRLGCVLALVEHKRDSIGIAMSPIGFLVPAELPTSEDWSASSALLERLETAWQTHRPHDSL